MDAEQYKEFEQRLKLADEYEHPMPDEKAWNAMSAKLDAAFGKEKKRRSIWLFILPAILISVPILFFASRNNDGMAKRIITAKNNAGVTSLNAPEKNVEKSAGTAGAETSYEESLPIRRVEMQKRDASNSYAIQNEENLNNVLYKKHKAVNTNFILEDGGKTRGHKEIAPNISLYSNDVRDRQTLISTGTQDSTYSLDIPVNNLAINKQINTPSTTEDSSNKLNDEVSIDKPKKRVAGSQSSRLYISASISPNKSFISSDGGKWTTAYGGSIGYLLGKKWFVEGGAFAGRALYHAAPEDYKWESRYGYALKSVTADCFIIDLPLNVGYTLLNKGKIQLFSTAGVSSQIMKKEEYDYTVVRNAAEYKGTWNYKNENKHFISTAQVSLGVAYKMSNRINMQAAPFFKKSLKGVGEGEVRLNGAGINLNMQVFPFFKRKKQ